MQFIVGNRRVTITIPPFVLFLMLLSALMGYALAQHQARSGQLELEVARARNQQLELELHRKRAELQRASEIAEARLQELWEELQQRRAEVNELWKQLDPRPVRRARLASRSGRGPRNLQRRLCALQSEVASNRREMEQLRSAALYRLAQERWRHTPSGPPCSGEMTSGFGPRTHPIYGIGRPHNGQDFTTDWGTPIYATADGVVVRADWLGGYGQAIEIDHRYGVKTLYAHCSEVVVKNGQAVRRGQLIGRVGATGLASGPHCHYEVHVHGKPVDPKNFLALHPGANLKLAAWRGWSLLAGAVLRPH